MRGIGDLIILTRRTVVNVPRHAIADNRLQKQTYRRRPACFFVFPMQAGCLRYNFRRLFVMSRYYARISGARS